MFSRQGGNPPPATPDPAERSTRTGRAGNAEKWCGATRPDDGDGGRRGKTPKTRGALHPEREPRKIARMWDYNPTKSASFARAFNPN